MEDPNPTPSSTEVDDQAISERWDDARSIATAVVAVAIIILDLFLLTTLPCARNALRRLTKQAAVSQVNSARQSVSVSGGNPGTGTVAPGGQPAAAPPASGGGGASEPGGGEKPFNWLKACLAGVETEPPKPTGQESLSDAFLAILKGFAASLGPALCTAGFTAALRICFAIAAILLVLAILLYALSYLLGAAEKKCRHKKKKHWWQKFLCFLVTILRWITLVLSIISAIAAVVVAIYCLLQLFTV